MDSVRVYQNTGMVVRHWVSDAVGHDAYWPVQHGVLTVVRDTFDVALQIFVYRALEAELS